MSIIQCEDKDLEGEYGLTTEFRGSTSIPGSELAQYTRGALTVEFQNLTIGINSDREFRVLLRICKSGTESLIEIPRSSPMFTSWKIAELMSENGYVIGSNGHLEVKNGAAEVLPIADNTDGTLGGHTGIFDSGKPKGVTWDAESKQQEHRLNVPIQSTPTITATAADTATSETRKRGTLDEVVSESKQLEPRRKRAKKKRGRTRRKQGHQIGKRAISTMKPADLELYLGRRYAERRGNITQVLKDLVGTLESGKLTFYKMEAASGKIKNAN